MHFPGKRVSCTEDQSLISGSRRGWINYAKSDPLLPPPPPSTNPESAPGRPDMLYFLPEIINTEENKTVVTTDDVELDEETCGLQNVQLPCSPEFSSLAEIIMRENGLMMPTNANHAKALYIELLEKIKEVADNL